MKTPSSFGGRLAASLAAGALAAVFGAQAEASPAPPAGAWFFGGYLLGGQTEY